MLTAEDREQFVEKLKLMSSPVSEVLHIARDLIDRQKTGLLDTSRGVSLLEVKNQLMLSYIINLCHLMHDKLSAVSIERSTDVERLVDIRTVLEKMRPMDQKIKYQTDKIIRISKMGGNVDNDPLRLKPNPDNFVANEEELSDTEAASNIEETADKTSKVYKPARLAPVYYDGEESAKQKKERELTVAKKRLANSAIVKDLQREYIDGPEEIRETSGCHRPKQDQLLKERKIYEEKYFIRMNMSKKEKTELKKRRQMSGLEGITNFSELKFLSGRSESKSTKRKRGGQSSKHKAGKSAKRRKFRK